MPIVTFASLAVNVSSELFDEHIRVEITPDGDASRRQMVERAGLGAGSIIPLGVTMSFTTEVIAEVTEIDVITPNDRLGTVRIGAGDPVGPFSESFSGDGGNYTLTGNLLPDVPDVPEPDLPDTPPVPLVPQPLHVLVDNPLQVLGLVEGLANINSAIGNVVSAQTALGTAASTIGTNLGGISTAISSVGTGISGVETALNGVDTSIDTVATNVGLLRPELTSLNTTVGSLRPGIDGTAAALGTTNTTLGAISASLGTLAQIRTELTDLNSKVGTANTRLADIVSMLQQIRDKLPSV
jgi:uncharacterized phage infection (PIP) family protein YhgE